MIFRFGSKRVDELKEEVEELEVNLDKMESKVNSLCELLGVAFSDVGLYRAKAHYIVKDEKKSS